MRKQKEMMLGMFVLVGIVLISLISAVSFSSPQISAPGGNSFSYLQKQGINTFPVFNENQCEAGQDFIVQIAPFGCTPAVVRSDLLEEQNVPVFCQLYATKINPLIDVEAVDFISFDGEYPNEIAGVGFHPASAAIKSSSTTLLNSPVLQNIGYAVVVLKQNPNESSMPDFVSGNLTANIKYDIQNAFGVGGVSRYIPETSDEEWDENYAQYGFWDGKGFLRVEGVEAEGATVSIYSDKANKISSFNLLKGETSGSVSLPGFYCRASLNVRVDEIRSPDTRAILNINGEIYEVAEGERFLDNNCVVRNVEKKGFVKKVEIGCREDDGFETLNFDVNPKIKLKINGETKEVKLGDKLYQDGTGTVYLAYVGTEGNVEDSTKLFVYLMKSEKNKDSLNEDELASANSLVGMLLYSKVSSSGLIDLPANALKWINGQANRLGRTVFTGQKIGRADYNVEQNLFGTNVKIEGFAVAQDEDLSSDELSKEYYEKAMSDYREIIDNFENEKDSSSDKTFGMQALKKAIGVSVLMRQKQTVSDLCDEFREKYHASEFPTDNREVDELCSPFKIANEGVEANGVVINGRAKTIFLEDVSEPSLDDFSAEIIVQRANGNAEGYILTKNEILTLNENPENIFKYKLSQPITISNSEIPLIYIHFGFIGGEWKWSFDQINWYGLNQFSGKFAGSSITLTEQKEKALFEGLQKISVDKYENGKKYLLDNKALSEPYKLGSDYIQLLDLTQDSARVRVNFRGVQASDIFTDELTIKKNVGEGAGGYIFTVTKINLKNVARVSVVPSIKNIGTEANFSFNIGIEKRLVQLSPDKIKERIEQLNDSIEKWEDTSEKVGEVVKGFNAACLAVGTGLTIKNLFENFDGRAIARQEVMRSPGGWMNFCTDAVNDKEYSTVDECLLENNDKIEGDVDLFEGIIGNQENITTKNIGVRLAEIKGQLGNSITNPDDKTKSISISGDIEAAFTKEGYDKGGITLSQARDLDRLSQISKSNQASPEMKKLAEKKIYAILFDVKSNSENFAKLQKAQENLAGLGISGPITIRSRQGEFTTREFYDGLLAPTNGIKEIPGGKEFQGINFNNEIYLVTLDYIGGDDYRIVDVFDSNGNKVSDSDATTIKNSYSSFKKYDRITYENRYKNPEVRYFETAPYNGLPAIVPFDINKGWYAGTKQTLPGLGNIRAYDESGEIRSFHLCNVGKNGIEEFNSDIGDDVCRTFNPGTQQINGEFPGLEPSEVNRLVANAKEAVQDASRQHSQGVNRVSILNQFISVGEPSIGTPDIQCQDFMSAKECNVLFNACDPVVCPSSRCNLGGTYTVPDVIQSGIIGSAALCLPNARENIVVPVCLSGIKAGIDGFVSVQRNYRDCLQTNLETGETVGICDEIHSIYLCDFFWSQAQPLAGVIVPKIFEVIKGQTGRGGGEYLGVASSWENAQRSIDYMTNYYGAASFEAFRTGVIKEVGNAICRNFVSASYPDVNFFDSLIEPESPPQYTAWFSESPYTTATVPPTSRYKVFYHIFAGESTLQANGVRNSGVFYSVYLKTPQTGSFFNAAQTVQLADGFIPPGEIASETRDFTAPSGYQELCVNVNGQEECGFNRVSTDFGLDYLQDLARAEQGEQTDIDSEGECVSGTPSLYSLVNPNLQDAAQNLIDPNLYAQQIVRVCSTDNPGRGTDSFADGPQSRWVAVGTCDASGKLKCYLDQDSVKKVIKSTEIEDATLKTTSENFIDQLKKENQFTDIKNVTTKINSLKDNLAKANYITTDLIARAYLNIEKAFLIMTRADAYKALVEKRRQEIEGANVKVQAAASSGGGAGGSATETKTWTCPSNGRNCNLDNVWNDNKQFRDNFKNDKIEFLKANTIYKTGDASVGGVFYIANPGQEIIIAPGGVIKAVTEEKTKADSKTQTTTNKATF